MHIPCENFQSVQSHPSCFLINNLMQIKFQATREKLGLEEEHGRKMNYIQKMAKRVRLLELQVHDVHEQHIRNTQVSLSLGFCMSLLKGERVMTRVTRFYLWCIDLFICACLINNQQLGCACISPLNIFFYLSHICMYDVCKSVYLYTYDQFILVVALIAFQNYASTIDLQAVADLIYLKQGSINPCHCSLGNETSSLQFLKTCLIRSRFYLYCS